MSPKRPLHPEDSASEIYPTCFYCGIGNDWQPGPKGGSSQNMTCRNCGQKINVAHIGGEAVWGEVIGVDEDRRRVYQARIQRWT